MKVAYSILTRYSDRKVNSGPFLSHSEGRPESHNTTVMNAMSNNTPERDQRSTKATWSRSNSIFDHLRENPVQWMLFNTFRHYSSNQYFQAIPHQTSQPPLISTVEAAVVNSPKTRNSAHSTLVHPDSIIE